MFQVGGERPSTVFDVPSRYEDGRELQILHERYERRGDSRLVGGTVIIPPHGAGTHEVHVSVSLRQSIYPWRELGHPAKEVAFSARIAGKSLPYDVVPASAVGMLSSWCTFQARLEPAATETCIDFSILHPWNRLVKSQVRAFLLQRGERE
jgi:hypothetical protein